MTFQKQIKDPLISQQAPKSSKLNQPVLHVKGWPAVPFVTFSANNGRQILTFALSALTTEPFSCLESIPLNLAINQHK
jgi:hypothetical protein